VHGQRVARRRAASGRAMARLSDAPTAGDFPPPPGFEDYSGDNEPDEAALAEFRQFMIGTSSTADPTAVVLPGASATSEAEATVSLVRAAAATTSAVGSSAAATALVPAAKWSQRPPRGSGLVGERQASVEIRDADGSSTFAGESDLLDKEASFDDLGLSADLLRGVYEAGFVVPSKIQSGALPIICRKEGGKLGQNMIGQAQNGSGKTATFALALLSAIDIADPIPQAMVICPTRELARQNQDVISQLGQYMSVITQLVVPGLERVPRHPRCHVLVGTPGKILDLTKKHIIECTGIRIFVLDEADMMLDQENAMGPQVTQIRRLLPDDLQVLFFSATYPDDVRSFAEHLVPRAFSIKVKKTDLTVSSVSQMYLPCIDDHDKFQKLTSLYGAMNVGQSVVFVNQRNKAFSLAKAMRDAGFAVSLICGTQAQGQEKMDPALRDEVMGQFRSGVTRVLIATDVLSRGIDVPQVTLVVNYELPKNFVGGGADMETYLHRVGRTGRFGLRGIAVNLVLERTERAMVDEIRAFFACTIDMLDEDFEALEERLRTIR